MYYSEVEKPKRCPKCNCVIKDNPVEMRWRLNRVKKEKTLFGMICSECGSDLLEGKERVFKL